MKAAAVVLLASSSAWADAPRVFASLAGQPAHIRVTWTGAPAAAKYRARWSGEEVPLAAPVFERDEDQPGHYELQIAAIDAQGEETSEAEIGVDVIAVHATPPGGDVPHAGTTAFAVGTTFSAPGLRCHFAGGEPAESARAIAIGQQTLTCGDVSVPVIVAPVVIAAQLPPLPRGATTVVHVTVASVAPVGDRLDIVATGDVTLGPAQRTEAGLDIPVEVPATARTASLAIESGGLELGHVDLVLGQAHDAPAAPAGWYALDVGGHIGLFVPPGSTRGASTIGHPSNPTGSLTTGPLAGGRIGVFPIPRIGVEGEIALATAGYAGQSGTAMVALARAQLAARIVEADRYGLRLLAGVDVADVLAARGASSTGSEGGVHLGAAFTIETRPSLWVRVEALDMITPAQDASYAHCFELQVGLVTRLGRHDRW